jgi:DNA modification methylase
VGPPSRGPFFMIHCGDALTVLRTLVSESVHCCVTSPPYWGLRDYGVSAQLGLERTPEEYIARMVEVFREVRRVLRADGTLWLNIGDSYSNDTKWCGHSGGKNYTISAGGYQGQRVRRNKDCDPKRGDSAPGQPMDRCCGPGLKPKDLAGIPWALAFALRADGWYLRSEIIWHKPNPMPESVADRPTKAHEQIFLLAKSESYFYDCDAIREPQNGWNGSKFDGPRDLEIRPNTWRKPRSWPSGGLQMGAGGAKGDAPRTTHDAGRNKRSVWTIATQPYPEAHFATFPEALVEPCVKAGCPAGGVVLDPFCGSGTVGLVARRLSCDFVGIELNSEYVKLAEKRLAQQVLPLVE